MIQSSFQDRNRAHEARPDKLEVERKKGKLKSTRKPQLEGRLTVSWQTDGEDDDQLVPQRRVVTGQIDIR